MDIENMTADNWLDEYEAVPEGERCEFIMDTLKQGISPELADEIDFTESLMQCFDDLKREKKHDKILEILEFAEENNPELPINGNIYLDAYKADIYAFRYQKEEITKSMKSMTDNPIDSLDLFIPAVNKLLYYGHSEFVLDISKKVYDEVANSKELIPDSSDTFASIILMMKVQNSYERFIKGLDIDRSEFIEYLKEYGYIDADLLNMVLDTLVVDIDLSGLSYEELDQNRNLFYYKLVFSFCKYALGKNMNFPTAGDIWSAVWENFNHEDLKDKNDTQLNSFFKLNEDGFHNYIFNRFGFLSSRTQEGFTALWGLPYVYDFLYKNALVDQETYAEVIRFGNRKKMELLDGIKDKIWEYAFVHSWKKPDSMSEDDFINEKEYFERSFYEKTDVRDYLPEEYFIQEELRKLKIKKSRTVRNSDTRVGRNDPCPCGSGKKYKKCCG